MFDHCHYVPIVKTKKGELDAVEHQQVHLGSFTPLWEVFGDYDDSDSVNSASLRIIAGKIKKSWGNPRPCFVDSSILQNHTAINGKHPAEVLFDELYSCGVMAIPVVSPDSPAPYQQAIENVLVARGNGVCFRLFPDYEEGDQDLNHEIENLLRRFRVDKQLCDVIIDLWTTDLMTTGLLTSAISTTVNNIRSVNDFRTLTLASAAFPRSMAGIAKGISTIRRMDWVLWTTLLSRHHLIRRPSYGDYTCLNPEVIDFDPTTMTPAAKIRYTSQLEWLIIKGGRLKGNGGQYHNLAANLIARAEFMGASFSWGDSYIYSCARRACGPGNLPTWVAVDVNHHISYVLHQLRSEICPDSL